MTGTVRFLQDYQGELTGAGFFRSGQQVEFNLSTCCLLVDDGRAKWVETETIEESAPIEETPAVPVPAAPRRRHRR